MTPSQGDEDTAMPETHGQAHTTTPPGLPESGLKRDAISALGIVFMVVAAASPLIGLTGAVPSAMVIGNGNAAPAAYVFVGLVLLLFGVGYVAMSRQVTNAGALYAYIGRGLGLRLGLGGASVAVWAYTAVQIAVYGFFGVVASGSLADWFGWDVPWWLLTLGLVALVQVFGYLQIEVGAKVLGVLMAVEWGVMLLLATVIAVKGGAGEGYAVKEVFAPTSWLQGAPGVALVFAFASTFGFESAALYGEEARDPKKSVARATYASVLAIMLFFLFTSWMLIVGYGPSRSVDVAGAALQSGNPAAYVFDAGAEYLGSWAPDLMSVFVLTSMFACALAFHNGIARYLFTLGRDNVLPTALSDTNRHGSPFKSSVAQTVSVVALMAPFMLTGQDPITTLFFWGGGIAVVGVVTLYVLASIATVMFFSKNPDLDSRSWNTKVAPTSAAVVLVSAMILILYNFHTLVGGTPGTATLLALTVPTAVVVGLVLYSAVQGRLSSEAMADLEQEIT